LIAACGTRAPARELKLWHTFGPEETGALNEALAKIDRDEGWHVVATVLPFGLAKNRLDATLREGAACPDLARIDVTWLPSLAGAGLLSEAPEGAIDGFGAQATELARWQDKTWGVPQAIDGLAILHEGTIDPPATLDALTALALGLTTKDRRGISVRGDGYWFVAWLRAAGGDLDQIDGAAAEDALGRYAALIEQGIAARPDPGGDEAALEADRFARGELALVIGGPWTVAAIERASDGKIDLHVTPFPRAPDGRAAAPGGGQLYVVPRCAAHPAEAWRLAARLTDAALEADWSRRLGVVPARTAALDDASPIAREFVAALAATRPLPRDARTPLLFDDLTPAVQAVLAGDATPAEALAGVRRAWARLP
jgi:ABC-type glycerol-3-phosphate transport system substrate-binding protein